MSAREETVSMPKPRQTPYGVLRAAPFIGDPMLPKTSEVVIIGGGIMGVTTALYLAKRGVQVLLCEKAEIACEASSRAFGWVSELMLDPIKQPMTQLSKRLWAELQAEIGETGFRRTGLVSLAESEQDLAMFGEWLDHVHGGIGEGTRLLTPAEVAERFPTAQRGFAGGLFSPTDGSAEPVLAVPALAEAARRAGVRIVTDCAVRGLDLKAGRVAGLFTEKGYVETSTVVCAANCWTRLFCGNHGVDIPQIYVLMTMAATGRTDGPTGCGGVMSWSWRRQIDGHYTLGALVGVRAPVTRDAIGMRKQYKPLMEMMGGGKLDFGRDAWNDWALPRSWNPRKTSPFEKLRVLSGRPDKRIGDIALSGTAAAFPEMADSGIAETWAGPISLVPDNKPILGAVDAIPGFNVITGTSFGITWGPAIGKMMSELITGAATSFDPHPFRLSRFTDGSPIVVAH